jgi:cellulose synthase (UDP-forming)
VGFTSPEDRARRGTAILAAYLLIAAAYLAWRSTVVNWDAVYGPIVYAAELYGGFMTALFLWVVRRPRVPVPHDTELARSVDALICTYREPLDVLEPTVLGALRVRGIDSILVLDDGNRPAVREMAARLGVAYHARTTNKDCKAGNLNNGLRHSTADFILLLDADHVPTPAFLERTIGYFDDDSLAFVQTPQAFYNRDSFLFRRTRRRVWSEQGMFYTCIQPAKNRTNSAFFVGTSAVLRRRALDQVGGFATGSVSEDIHTSLRLHAAGWQSVFVPETLAYGLEAASLREFHRQRRRWATGSLGLLFRSADSPLRSRGLSVSQRLSYLEATLAHLQGIQRLIFFCTPILAILTRTSPVTVKISYFAAFFVVFAATGVASTALSARGTYHLVHTEAYSLANSLAQCAALRGIVSVQTRFAVSGKSMTRRERTWARPLLLVLAITALASVGRAVQLLITGGAGRGLLLASGVVASLNLTILLSFLVFLRRYERREVPVSGAAATSALARYHDILDLGAQVLTGRHRVIPKTITPGLRRRPVILALPAALLLVGGAAIAGVAIAGGGQAPTVHDAYARVQAAVHDPGGRGVPALRAPQQEIDALYPGCQTQPIGAIPSGRRRDVAIFGARRLLIGGSSARHCAALGLSVPRATAPAPRPILG